MLYEKVLDGPYFAQPTAITCQSTCLKMFAKYLEQKFRVSSAAGAKSISEIWKEINEAPGRPHVARNSYENIRWWLEKNFSSVGFEVQSTRNVDEAIQILVKCINQDYPVMVSTNHSRTDGHIILVVGYESYDPNASDPAIRFVCHDPYGRFNPSAKSRSFGKRRFNTGFSLAAGGEIGPGKGVKYDYAGIRRVRRDKHSSGNRCAVFGA